MVIADEVTAAIAGPLSAGLPVAVQHHEVAMHVPNSDPVDRAIAEEAVRAMAVGLPRVVEDPTDLSGREQVLYAAYLAATAFSCAGSGLHHTICHVLGGRYDLPHAQTHVIVLPHVLSLNVPSCAEAGLRLARAFGAATAVEGVRAFRERVHAPRALRDLGLAESSIADAARAVATVVPTGTRRRSRSMSWKVCSERPGRVASLGEGTPLPSSGRARRDRVVGGARRCSRDGPGARTTPPGLVDAHLPPQRGRRDVARLHRSSA